MNAPSGSLNDLSTASKPSGLKASFFPCPFQRAKSCAVWTSAISAFAELPLDFLIQHIAEAAFDRHGQARKLALEFSRQGLVVRHRTAGIDHQRLVGLGFGVELVERFGARWRAEQPDGKTQRQRTVQGNPSDRGEHSFLPQFIHAFSRKKNASQSPGPSTSASTARTRQDRVRDRSDRAMSRRLSIGPAASARRRSESRRRAWRNDRCRATADDRPAPAYAGSRACP